MSDERPSDVLGALPRRRPHRRSDKRAAPASATATREAPAPRKARAPRKAPATRSAPVSQVPKAAGPERLRQPAQPAGVPPTAPAVDRTDHGTGRDVLGIAAQAAAELAEIGLTAGARALRNAVARLPRP